MVAETLAGVQLVHYQQPTILLALSVGGEEDVPDVRYALSGHNLHSHVH